MNQFLIPMKSSQNPNAIMQPANLPGNKIWVALFPGLKTPVKEGTIAMVTAYAFANTTIAPELQ